MGDSGPFARFVRERRKELDLTQDELATRAAISTSALWKLEKGQRKPSRQLAEALAEALDIPPRERTRFLRLARGGAEDEEEGPPNNLPAQLTRLIGREAEVEALATMLRAGGSRLVTVMGSPGVGKTRLALAAAEQLLDSFSDGVFMVVLAPVREVEGVTRAIAAALGLRDTGREPLSLTLRDFLRGKQVLLLLDNFEQLIPAATLVTDLLERCPQVRALVTSREALRVRGERQVQVRPLLAPGTAHPLDFDKLLEYPAVQMFVERAQHAAAGFGLTPENAGAVAAICAHLEGLPLAIELVAARTRLLPPTTLLGMLARRGGGQPGASTLQVLAAGPRDVPERHRTLREAIRWSYDLLSPDERCLFTRLAVFVGGWGLGSAEAVCNAASDLRAPLFEMLQSLLEKSLLKEQPLGRSDEEPRFSMLELVREYGLEQLEDGGEAEQLRQWHAQYFLALARATEPELIGADQKASLDRLERDHDNIRAALEWLVSRGDLETAARLAGPLARFWLVHGHLGEGRAWLERLLQGSLPADVRAKALHGSGLLARNQGDYEAAQAMLEECLVLFRGLGHRASIAGAIKDLGTVFDYSGDLERAAVLYRQSEGLYRELEDWWGVAASLNNRAVVANIQGRREEALALYGESLELRRHIGDKWGVASSLNNLGLTYYHEERHERAEAIWEESLALFEEIEDKASAAIVLGHLGRSAYTRGDYGRASDLLSRSLEIRKALGDRHGTALTLGYLSEASLRQGKYAEAGKLAQRCLALVRSMGVKLNTIEAVEVFGNLAAAEGQPERAARLYAATEEARHGAEMPRPPARQAEHEHYLIMARAQLDAAAWEEAWRAGQAMSLDDAATYALSR